MVFQGKELKEEQKQNKLRFLFIRDSLISALGNAEQTAQFINMYLSEMLKPENVLFYNKFIVSEEKTVRTEEI